MSRRGRKPIVIPAGITVKVEGAQVVAKGAKGELKTVLPLPVQAVLKDGTVEVTCADESARGRSYLGLSYALIANMLAGLSSGFSKELELQGVGFKASVQGGKLLLSIGFSRPVEYQAPAGISLQVKENNIFVSGPDKQVVGDVAARIRSFYPPEPYKGKGVRYKGEYVRRKTGKTVA